MTEDQLEQEALSWLIEVGYTHLSGYNIAPDGPAPERDNFRQVLLPQRLRDAIARLNPHTPLAARDDAFKQVQDLGTPVLLSANRHFHRLLVGGVPVQYQKDGETRGDFVRLVGWGNAAANEWLAINQFSLKGPHQNRSIETAQVMEELVEMAKKFREAASRGESLGLSDETLKKIAHELTESLRQNISVDWAQRESVRAKLRLMVKRILRKYKYPPDLADAAVELVLEQAKTIGDEWVH